MRQLIFGLTAEGPTDIRFFESLIERTLLEVSNECTKEHTILPIFHLKKLLGEFVPRYLETAKLAHQFGLMGIFLHVDADRPDESEVLNTRIAPLMEAIKNYSEGDICRDIVPIIPIYMTEAWMLADLDLLRYELGTSLEPNALGLGKAPEKIPDPKAAIINAIRIAESGRARRRRTLEIADLYQIMGKKIPLQKLRLLESYRNFENSIRDCYHSLGLLR